MNNSFDMGLELLKDPSFETFDRLDFLMECINPLYGYILEIQIGLGIELPHEMNRKPTAVNYMAENIFSKDDKHWFVDNVQQYFTPYFRQLTDINSTHFYGISPFKEVWLSSLWINFMKKGEYNPPHNHDGAFSFVLYLQVPEELNHEDKNFHAN